MHGGCTPEEVLVPFILLSNKNIPGSIRYEIKCGRLEKRRQEVTEEQIQSMISRYEAGMSLNMIAKEMMMSRKKVTMILEEKGVKKQ